jgi:hypothetical protein
MREYSNKISLTQNDRGIYSIDTSIGCASGMQNNKGGCYNDCYAAKSAKLYGYDFSKTVQRLFESESHKRQIVNKISKIKLDFIRIGTSGDPSENWQHTINICKIISKANKEIVIITKHWTLLTDEQLEILSKLNVCFNTSISALDKTELLNSCLFQYNRIKKYCKSILRIVSCDFNTSNEIGLQLSIIQKSLFLNDNIIDTVLRVNKNNQLVKDGIINVHKTKFLGKNALISKYNKKTYFGKCSTCLEMCGVNIKDNNNKYQSTIIKQTTLF